ncbi:hypothetical protein [Pallidibacillus pasinlerensis]|uniref:Uncharacterized protein n=1 Tax=Pallidibacillus pasinlerensis TaxID=2703818 RepID=A0ABX0A050_9BACI|nr:hypothetical protein [Pallidibacillus pasinlerensis]NCU16805.1 hypothetical protein [Pallidibacillus pasinlerensis]
MDKKSLQRLIVSLLLASIALNIYLYKESSQAKWEMGEAWQTIIGNADSTVDFLRRVNLNETAETENGKRILQEMEFQLNDLSSNFSSAHEVLEESSKVLRKVIEEGQVSEEEIRIYQDNLGIFETILYRINETLKYDRAEWYKAFADEDGPRKIDQLIEETIAELKK